MSSDVALVVDTLRTGGGVMSRGSLVRATSRRAVDRALRVEAVTVLRRGVYALPELDEAVAVAAAAGGVLSLTSAALWHGWAVKLVPKVPHVTLARGRTVRTGLAGKARWHRGDLLADDVVDGLVTSREVTLLQCLRQLPRDEALAVADSAARAGETALLHRVAAQATGPGSRQVKWAVERARAESANPFESVLRAICLTIPGLDVDPQVWIRSVTPWARPDLVDVERRIVIEADSFEWHGSRPALERDARRYNRLIADGWLVLRFTWNDVMFDADHVRSVLVAVADLVRASTERPCWRCHAA